jgi:thiosulfate dehydrogenase
MKNNQENINAQLIKIIQQLLGIIVAFILFLFFMLYVSYFGMPDFRNSEATTAETVSTSTQIAETKPKSEFWEAPDVNTASEDVKYGRELIMHTSQYLGPNGSVLKITNGMNCQNCHLDAGTKTFGNNYSAVASTYPNSELVRAAKKVLRKG